MPSGQAETQREARPAEIREGFLEEEPSTLCQGKGARDKGDPQRASTSKGTKRHLSSLGARAQTAASSRDESIWKRGRSHRRGVFLLWRVASDMVTVTMSRQLRHTGGSRRVQ